MARTGLSWQNAKLPPNTAVFAIGDIHANAAMLKTLLKSIEDNIKTLRHSKPDKIIHVIGIGDYIDRGESTSQTIDALLAFKQNMQERYGVHTTYLVGNHDECFDRFLHATRIVPNLAMPENPADPHNVITRPDGSISLSAFAEWMDSGGGYTTLRNYCPSMDETFLAHAKACKDPRQAAPELLAQTTQEANVILRELQQRVPQAHRDFFDQVYQNDYLILGDFLFTHAGVDPNKSMAEQGIGSDHQLTPLEKFNSHMIRNPFLWRDKLDNCPYIVIHGHTPTIIKPQSDSPDAIIRQAQPTTVVDPQKPYRLGIDTGVFNEGGALTAMVHDGKNLSFLAVNRDDPATTIAYSLNPHAMQRAASQHRAAAPQYHPGGSDYFGAPAPSLSWTEWAAQRFGFSR